MTDEPKTLADIVDFMIDWNDRAAAWMKGQREQWEDHDSEDDAYYNQCTICFDRPGLDLFMRNQEAAAKWLRLIALSIAEKDTTP